MRPRGFVVGLVTGLTGLLSTMAPAVADGKRPVLFEDPRAFEAFFDRYLSDSAREQRHVVGATLVAVDRAGVRTLRGYGVRDLESRVPVDARQDLFFVASISKTFIGTAVMRLVQQGRLKLDDDLRRVIKSFVVPDRFGEPILVRHALTHTTGIVDRLDGTSARTREEMIPLLEVMRRFPGEQRASPGRVTSYCNWCIAMLAVAIQDVTGIDYREFLLREVLEPLGMHDATILLPPMSNAAALEPRLVSLYMWDRRSQRYTPYPPMYRSLYPNGSLAASAAAMAPYMRMFLCEGTLDGLSFLEPRHVRAMLSPQDWPHPKVPTFGLSMKYGVQNGVRYLGHSGNYRGADSSMVIFPDHDFAYFLSYTGGNATYHRRILVDLIDTAFPRAPERVVPLPDARERAARYAGRYTDFRFLLNSPMAFAMLFPGQTRIAANDDGSISLTIPRPYFDGGTVRYVEVEPRLFRKIDVGDPNGIGPNLIDHLVFIEDEHGAVRYFTTAVNNHAISGAKVPWYAYLPVAITALGACTALFVAYALGWVVAVVARHWRGGRRAPARMPARAVEVPRNATLAALVLSLSASAFVVKYLITMTAQQDWAILYSFRALGLHAWFVLPLLAAAATLILLAMLPRIWRAGLGSRSARIVHTAVGVAGVIYTLQMAQYRVLDYYF